MNKLHSGCTLLLLSGKDSPTHYENSVTMKLSYIPPYAEFDLLKKLELKIRRLSERKAPDTLVLDVTEWAEHTGDEFFDIMAKYFHDHRDYRYVFTSHSERVEIMPMFTILRTFLPISIEEDRTFADPSVLTGYIKEHYRVSPHAAEYLAGLVMKYEGEPLRSYVTLHTLFDELTKGGRETVGFKTLIYNIHDRNTLLGALFADMTDTGGNKYEYEKAI